MLDASPKDILDSGKEKDTNYLVYLHLSVLSGFFIPEGNIILPLILWLTKKDKIIGLKEIGANILNFQICLTILQFTFVMIFAFFKIMHFPFVYMFIYLAIALWIINFILPIVFAIKTKKGKIEAMYPNLVKFIRSC